MTQRHSTCVKRLVAGLVVLMTATLLAPVRPAAAATPAPSAETRASVPTVPTVDRRAEPLADSAPAGPVAPAEPDASTTEAPAAAATSPRDDTPEPGPVPRRREPAPKPTPVTAASIVSTPDGTAPPASLDEPETILNVHLSVLPHDDQDVAFTSCRDDDCTTFTLDDDTDPTLEHVAQFRGTAPGTYTITQAAISGWALTRIECGFGAVVDLSLGQVTVEVAEGATVDCVFDNRSPQVTVHLDAAPDDAQDFTFALCPTSGPCHDLTLDDDTDPTRQASATVQGIEAGPWTLTAASVQGWGLTSLTCTEGETDLAGSHASFVLLVESRVTCTFVEKQTTFTLSQTTDPDDPQDFTYTGCAGPGGSLGCGPIVLDDDDDPTLPRSIISITLTPGVEYTITQDVVPGFPLTAISCPRGVVDLANRRVTVVLAAGDQTSCRFTNRPTSVTIVQDTLAGGPQDFSFHCAGGATPPCAPFSLDDDSDPALASSVTLTGLESGTPLTITQDESHGWGLVSLNCSVGSVDRTARRATLVLQPGEQATCTFRNRVTSITVIQDTVPDGPQDFTFVGCSGPGGALGCGPFTLDDDNDGAHSRTITARELGPGTYVITQDLIDGYGLTALSCTGGLVHRAARQATVVLEPGDQQTCTFTNKPTSITIVQDTVPDGPQDISYTGCSGPAGALGCGTFTLDDDNDPSLPRSVTYGGLTAGTAYTVTQTVPAGHGLTALSCTDGSTSLAQHRAVLILEPGDQVTCTFTDRPTSITVVQDTAPDNAQDFTYLGCTGPGGALGCGPFTLDDDNDPTFPRSVTASGLTGDHYVISQDLVPGWGLTALSCTNAIVDVAGRTATILVEPGEQITCTFTDRPTTLTVRHASEPAGPDAFDFHLCADATCTSFRLDNDPGSPLPSSTPVAVTPGTIYILSEDPVPGYGLTDLSCTSGLVQLTEGRVTFVLVPGQTMTCTFTDRLTSLTVLQNTDPDSSQDFTFAHCDATGPCGATTLDDDNDGTLPGWVTYSGVAGAHTVTQTAEAGYGLTRLTCTNGLTDLASRTATVTLSPGDQVTCTFTTSRTSITVVQNSVADHADDFGFEVCGPAAASCQSLALDDDGDATLPRSLTVAPLDEGTYTVTQAAVVGWGLTGLVCTGTGSHIALGAGRATVPLAAGAQVTCTFTSTQTTLTVAVDLPNAEPQDFTVEVCGPGAAPCTEVTLDEDDDPANPATMTLGPLAPGTYTVTQHLVSGYKTELSCTSGIVDPDALEATVVLDPAEQVTCHFLDFPTRLFVSVTPAVDEDFGFTICGPAGCVPVVINPAHATLLPSTPLHGIPEGDYTITPDDPPPGGRVLLGASCNRSFGTAPGGGVLVPMAPGDSTFCRFDYASS